VSRFGYLVLRGKPAIPPKKLPKFIVTKPRAFSKELLQGHVSLVSLVDSLSQRLMLFAQDSGATP